MKRDTGRVVTGALILFLLCCSAASVMAATTADGPVVYLNFNEGSGITALDASGHGNAGTIHGNAYRVDNNGCVKALVLDGNGGYVAIPYTSLNHPAAALTVSLWFYVNDTRPQTLVSTWHNGTGYRLAFDDGNDLFWSLGLENTGMVSVVVPHEKITPGQWHHVTGTYDGQTSRIYLDGVLRSQANTTGSLAYATKNYVIVGAAAGGTESPDPDAPMYLDGGIDEVRIYNRALSYSDVMDDRYQCTVTPGTGIIELANQTAPVFLTSGTVSLGPGETATRHLTFSNKSEEGSWQVAVPPGSQLTVSATDDYPGIYPDEWYVELKDQDTRITRVVAFPATLNTPATGTIASGNATVIVHYFGGFSRFPAGVSVTFTSIAVQPHSTVSSLPKVILEYPIIVIYSASWITLIALVVVIVWAHKRRVSKKP